MEILFNQLEALSSLQGRLPSVVRCYEINLKGRVTVLFDAQKKKKKKISLSNDVHLKDRNFMVYCACLSVTLH